MTLTTTHRPATDLGYLLAKHPARAQTFELSFGEVHVFYPEATEERCTAALLLDVDPVRLVRRPKGGEALALDQYTNDRPYVASSFMSVAINRVLRTAASGNSKSHQGLAETPIPLSATVHALRCRGQDTLLSELFEPLGYTVEATREPVDPQFPEWGLSSYQTVTLSGTVRLCDLLRHLTVLIPVLDDHKHYFIGKAEVDKLIDKGADWLPEHPLRELITRRYLGRRRSLENEARRRLVDDAADPEADDVAAEREEAALEKKVSLNAQRMETVVGTLQDLGARRVIDLGCGEGKLLRILQQKHFFTEIVGVDVSTDCLERAARKLRLREASDRQRERVRLLHGSVVYADRRFHGFDAGVAVEVIEHLDATRLDAFEAVVFGDARLPAVVITTPNQEYNQLFEGLPAGKMRHRDHRFEWTRAEFRAWAEPVAERHGYSVSFHPIGPVDEALGAPTQMAVFRK